MERVDANPTLRVPIYSSISESIELFLIYSNTRVTQNHHQSLQIIKNYPILSDLSESGEPLMHNTLLFVLQGTKNELFEPLIEKKYILCASGA